MDRVENATMVDIDGNYDFFSKLNLIDLARFRELRKTRHVLVVDTETADGMKKRTLAQIGYIVLDPEGNLVTKVNEFVSGAKQILWEGSQITMDQIRGGWPPELIRDRFIRDLNKYTPVVVAHNAQFDIGVIRKIGVDFCKTPIFCTCHDKEIRATCKIPLKNSTRYFKSPKQEELAKYCGINYTDLILHTAYDDVCLLWRILQDPLFF